MAALFRMSFVVIATVASRLIEKEPITVFRAVAVTLGIMGIFLMSDPFDIFGGNKSSSSQDVDQNVTLQFTNNSDSIDITSSCDFYVTMATIYGYVSQDTTNGTGQQTMNSRQDAISLRNLPNAFRTLIGVTLTVVAAVFGVLQGIVVKRKGLKDFCVWRLSFWSGVVGTVWTLSMCLILEKPVFFYSTYDLFLIGCHATLAAAHILTFIIAIKRTSYLIVAIVMATHILFNLLIQNTFMKDVFPGKQNAAEVIGGILVTLAATLPALSESCDLKCWKRSPLNDEIKQELLSKGSP